MEPTTNNIQPKTVHKLIVRTAIGAVAAAILFVGFTFITRTKDVDLPATFDSKGYLAAIQYLPSGGAQAVLISPSGEIIPNPGHTSGAQDRDLVWRPDGNRLYFASDRAENVYHMYRWNPGGNKVERRTFGTRSFGYPTFSTEAENDSKPLLASGGRVVELDPAEGSVHQILPPVMGKEHTDAQGEQASASPFDFFYKGIGSSFRTAKWALGRKYMVAVMRGEEGEALIVQPMEPDAAGNPQPPLILATAERVDFDVNPKDGKIVFSVNVPKTFARDVTQADWEGGRIQDLMQGETNKMPRHSVNVFQLDSDLRGPIIAGRDDKIAFGSPVLSPDGFSIAMVIGTYQGDGNLASAGIGVVPAQPGAGNAARGIVEGKATEPAWDAAGSKVAYVKVGEGGKRELHVVGSDGTGDQVIAAGKGEFGKPSFSPQR